MPSSVAELVVCMELVAVPTWFWRWDSRNFHLWWFLFSKGRAWALFAVNLASARMDGVTNGQEEAVADILPSQGASESWTAFIKEAENEDGLDEALDVDVQAVAKAMEASWICKATQGGRRD